METVFVWVSYGGSSVYRGDTREDVLAILKEMNRVAEANGDTVYDIDKLTKRMDEIGVDKMRKSINATVDEIAARSDDDRFEWGSGFIAVEKIED